MQTLLDSCNRFVGAAHGIQEARIHALRPYRVGIELNGYLKLFFRAGKIPIDYPRAIRPLPGLVLSLAGTRRASPI
jgi:hypothetical protein